MIILLALGSHHVIYCDVVGNRSRKKCSVANNAFPPVVSYQVSQAAWVLKPIFHCDAKPFALGTGVGLGPQCHTCVTLCKIYQHVGIFCVR